jgi:hypothetical protein
LNKHDRVNERGIAPRLFKQKVDSIPGVRRGGDESEVLWELLAEVSSTLYCQIFNAIE